MLHHSDTACVDAVTAWTVHYDQELCLGIPIPHSASRPGRVSSLKIGKYFLDWQKMAKTV